MIPTVTYYVFKNRVNKKGDAMIFLRFTTDRKSSYINTKIQIPYKHWNAAQQKLKAGYALANITNMLLEKKMAETRERLLLEAMHTKYITSRKAKETTNNKSNLNFFELVDQYLDDFRKQGKIGTADKSKTIFNKFEKFLGTRKITFYDIDERTLLNYQQFLRDEYSNGINTIYSNLKSIRRIFSIAVKRKIINSDADPFRGFELKTEKTNRDFLDAAELNALANLKLPAKSDLSKYRDIFVWTVITGGLRVSDVLLLRKKNIEGQYLKIIIKKTNTPHRIKMPEKAAHIIEKYVATCKTPEDFVFNLLPKGIDLSDPVVVDREISRSTATYNTGLKVLAKKAEIKKRLSSHTARISFTTLAVSNGVDMRTVQGILKHADLEMTAHYSKFVDIQGEKALADFESILKK